MAKNLFGGEIASKLLPHYSCISDTEEDENGHLVSDVCSWRSLQYSVALHLLDINTIKSVRDLKGNNSAKRCLESQRKYSGKMGNHFPCPELPRNCYSEKFLNDLQATHKVSLNVQEELPNLRELINSITPPELLQEINMEI